jgi:penicillin-binding protein 1A
MAEMGTTIRTRQGLFGRLTFGLLLLCSMGVGATAGTLFVYQMDLPEVRALEGFRPNTVTELYGDDGQVVGSFALQRRVLLTYEQIPQVLRDAVLVAEDQHFGEHWGVDFPGVVRAAWRNMRNMQVTEGASTLTMQLAGTLFLDRTDRSLRRKIQETLLALQVERHYTKEQIFAMYANQIYLGHGNYGFEAASQYYFGKTVGQLTIPEAALLAGILKGPRYSPILNPEGALIRRNYALRRLADEKKITEDQLRIFLKEPLGLNVQAARNDLGPYFVEEVRKHLERTYGTEAVHERGLRVYTTMNAAIQKAANRAVRDGLHAHERRRGWSGNLTNIFTAKLGDIETYQHPDWRRTMEVGDYVHGLVIAVDDRAATIKLGRYRASLTAGDFAWTGRRSPRQLLKVGDLPLLHVRELATTLAKVHLEQKPRAQAALVVIENSTGEIKALVGGYDFEESKFNRATQAFRQVGSSFKPYVYTTAIEQGYTPFDTIVDAPFTTTSGGQPYSPGNYDEKFEGTITLRRALMGSRNVPAVKLAAQIGIENVVQTARRFGVTARLDPYLPLALGAAEITLMEHTSAFTTFPNDGIRITPFFIRRVTSYDGALLEEAKPQVHEVLQPETARTVLAMLRDVVEYGTGVRAKQIGRPAGGKTGTTNDYSDAWFIGFTPTYTAGVWVGNDDHRISLGKKEAGSLAALPIWVKVMEAAHEGMPVQDFANVEPLARVALTKRVAVDTPDSAPTGDEAPPQAPRETPATPSPAKKPPNGELAPEPAPRPPQASGRR